MIARMKATSSAWQAAAVVLLGVASSCAIRTSSAEHYVGPILYRRGTPCRDGADVLQVVQLGGAGEAGRQWGVSLGLVERVSATPRDGMQGCAAEPRADGERRRWHFSPLYTRFEHSEVPRFVHRSIIGTQAVAGVESTAVSLGIVSATLLLPPPDAFCSFHYDGSDPTGMRFTVWTVRPDTDVPEEDILKEVER
jgi:hypothetical protein